MKICFSLLRRLRTLNQTITVCCCAFVLLCRLYCLPSPRHITFGPLTHRCLRSICMTDSLLQTSLLQRLTSCFVLSLTSTSWPPSAKSQHAAHCHGSVLLLLTSMLLSVTDREQNRDGMQQDLVCIKTCTTQQSILSLNLYCMLKSLILAQRYSVLLFKTALSHYESAS